KKNSQRVLVKLKGKDEELNLSLLGKHQIINLSLAIEGVKELDNLKYIKLDLDKVKSAVEKVKWNGRLEVLSRNPYIVLDGAHNASGVEFLKSNLSEYFIYSKLYLVLGVLADKEVEKMVKVLAPLATEVYTLTANSVRAEGAEELKNIVKKYNDNCIAFNDYSDAINYAKSKAKEDDLILASGSLYMIGTLRNIMKN
ncbi:MAG: cyanophycin synthetase, partial [Clostridium sp.]|uniref:glutamate ligase domain-containing protein n=1 Tax=Clostridium sp. TaxID=1506 RepID=UPI0029125C10